MKKITVDIWSDFVCPWCWVAKRRLERAIASLPEGTAVEIISHAYRIARGARPVPFDEALVRKFGNPQSAQAMMQAVQEQAGVEGLEYRFDTMRFGDTSDAHALVACVEPADLKQTLIEALMRAGTTDGRDIFDRQTLRQIALEAGVPAATVETCAFDASGIRQEEQAAGQIAGGVPLFVFGSRFYLSGAQPLEVFLQALQRALDEAPDMMPGKDGPACGVDGCH